MAKIFSHLLPRFASFFLFVLCQYCCKRFQEREDIESRATARAEFEKTFAFEDTFSLVAAVSHGKGIRYVVIH